MKEEAIDRIEKAAHVTNDVWRDLLLIRLMRGDTITRAIVQDIHSYVYKVAKDS